MFDVERAYAVSPHLTYAKGSLFFFSIPLGIAYDVKHRLFVVWDSQ